ncbi:MAG: prenyltransferase/squalene oxidase repeat-containing protein [Planctomycetota bacterium]|nr:prenyltransferase/squalene oxidase repeat-containing protein [Planctomycetota bacterium]
MGTPPPLPPTDSDVRRRRLLVVLSVAAILLVLLSVLGFLAGERLRPFRDGGGFDVAKNGRPVKSGQGNSPDSSKSEKPDSDASTPLEKATSPVETNTAKHVPAKTPGTTTDLAPKAPPGKPSRKKRPSRFVIPPPGKETQPLPSPGGGDSPSVVTEDSSFRSMFAGRSDKHRDRLLKSGGGTRESEDAVSRGLMWLKNHQHPTGNWSLDRFHEIAECGGRCADRRCGCRSDTAATALALLPFLGRGYTHRGNTFRNLVRMGLDWIIADQNSDGSFRGIGVGNMYAHAQATIVLCEALSMTGDSELLLDPATRAVRYILAAQSQGGGWRYTPNDPGDTSVQGWQIMALGSAINAKIPVAVSVLEKSNQFLDSAQTDSTGGHYGYLPGSAPPTSTMTAEALLCRQYCGWSRNHPGLKAGVEFLGNHLPRQGSVDMYYWYYATQVLHHWGGAEWQRWNPEIRNLLIRTQEQSGHKAGSWAPNGTAHDRRRGRVYMTALALCTLEVYYRHLPIFDKRPKQTK